MQCSICQREITHKFIQDSEGQYHIPCYEQNKCPKCDVCLQPIRGKYLIDPWGQYSHLVHQRQRIQQCHCCSRVIGAKTSNGGIQYGDGRIICGICKITEITDSQQIKHAKGLVIEQLMAVGLDYIPNYIAVSLADRRLLNTRLGVHQKTNSYGFTKTLKKEHPTLGPIMEHSIFILYGLPRLFFLGVLAHELLHVWLNERQIKLPEKEMEGFCNLGTYAIYQQNGTPLANLLLERLQNDPDPIYGDGFRKMQKRLLKKGWAQVIDEVQNYQPSSLQKFLNFTDKFIT